MKKLLFKSLFGITFAILILTYVTNPFFDKEESFFKKTITHFYESKNDSIDIIFFGSSHSMNSYNPNVIDKTLNVNSFNLASAAQKLKTTKYLIEESINNSKPKLVVLDLFPYMVTEIKSEEIKDYQLKVYNSTKNSLNKLEIVYKNFGLYELLMVYCPTTRNHSKWHEKDIADKTKFINKNNFERKGFLPLSGVIKENQKDKFKDFYTKQYSIYPIESSIDFLTKSQRDLILEIHSILDKENIELLFVSAPYFNYFFSEKNIKFHSSIQYLADSLNVKYLDFNNHFNKLDLDFKNFKERGHVNISGSYKLSSYLAKYISKKNQFEIKDNIYIEEYLNTLKPRTPKDIEYRINNEKINLIDLIINKGVYLKKAHKFTDEIENKEIIFYKDDFKKYVVLEYDKPINKAVFNKIQFGIQGVFYKKDYDLRPKWLLETNKDRMKWKSNPEFVTYKEKKYLILSFEKKSDIDKFKSLRLFLKDKGEYKGPIGNILEIKDVTFKNK